MKQTRAHDIANGDVLALIPRDATRVVEVGCSSGALAKAYLAINPTCEYVGIEIELEYAQMAKSSCTRTIAANIETMEDDVFDTLFPSSCWVFGDTLEHLYDPWAVLRRIRAKLSAGASVVACIPNAQHWSVQARLNAGSFRYEDAGLMDRTHIRWFTKATVIELFTSAGFKIVQGGPRVLQHEPDRDRVLAGVRALAEAIGADPQQAVSNAIPFQWVVRAIAV